MSRLSLKRRAGMPAWLVIAVLSAASCRDDQVAGPSDRPSDQPAPSLATTTTPLTFTQVSGGGFHTCGLTGGGQLYCWGSNGFGQLGDNSTQNHATPTLVAGGLLFRQVNAGTFHTCAVTTGNRVYCWGANFDGALGDGTTVQTRLAPVPVAGGRAFRQVSAGSNRTCALTTSTTNKIYCWGSGFLGNGSSNGNTTPQLLSGARTYRQVSVGGQHTCAVSTTNQVLCWGRNNYGQLGSGAASTFIAVNPVAVAGTFQYLQVSAGGIHTCAVTKTNKAYCWGYGRDGEIGDGKTNLRFTPRAVAGGLSFERVSAGGEHSCGETTGNRGYCWGANGNAQLGDGTFAQRLTPTAVTGGLFFNQVDAGAHHTCGLGSGSVLWCWGLNTDGQLGQGTFGNINPTPSQVQ
jgi:alpha-tubulin suppressor-like RCC1 family protein